MTTVPEIPHKAFQPGEIVLTEEEICNRVKELAAEIAADYKEKGIEEVVMVSLLTGGMPFTSDLGRELEKLGCSIERLVPLRVSSYGDGTTSSEKPVVTLTEKFDPTDKHLLIVDEMIDTGRSFAAVNNFFTNSQRASIHTVAFLDKPEARVVTFQADYVGFRAPMVWFEGYGLDTAQRYRFLPFIRVGGSDAKK